ncbi:MAG: ArsR family transcriptional regulator [Saprospiraceae bacterium]|nr:ArsR family transcriptional regulator [Saprospiraceae bacterium]MBK8450783.1 ArsR family transcriptional regulator [Saprospiraceae bacterium]MBK8485137.1 ArsR family transcriptional regulator [Saprospiraceae bacterium]MBK9223062.1 ArsR family transcriptional regulator [Saprospiraceae bacterium]MBK9720592.1 ArsR family transcriptional regulator [Saprospiraceae bacterium]
MEYKDCKDRFIETWGRLGPQWGINKTMAQIHALLLVASQPMTAEQVLNELQISQGNVNMNLRALLDWGLISKYSRDGERCEYYLAEKNLHIVFKQILSHRKKKELDPILADLDDLLACTEKCEKSKEFKKMVSEINDFAHKADNALELLLKTDSHWFYNTLMKML